jgi:hypothetical protein
MNSTAEAIFVGLVVGGFIFALTLVKLLEYGFPWSAVAIAERDRRRKMDALYVEYLGYGFDEPTASKMAGEKMTADAKAANEVTP